MRSALLRFALALAVLAAARAALVAIPGTWAWPLDQLRDAPPAAATLQACAC